VTAKSFDGVCSTAWGETTSGLVVLRSGAKTIAEAICERANQTLGKSQRLLI